MACPKTDDNLVNGWGRGGKQLPKHIYLKTGKKGKSINPKTAAHEPHPLTSSLARVDGLTMPTRRAEKGLLSINITV